MSEGRADAGSNPEDLASPGVAPPSGSRATSEISLPNSESAHAGLPVSPSADTLASLDAESEPVRTDPDGADIEELAEQAKGAVLLASTARVRELAKEGVIDRVLGGVTAWSRRSSLWPLLFGTACCFVEMAATAASRYDLSRFGSEVMRASPRQADLMIVPGTVTKRMVPLIVRLYHQMADPKWVIAMGSCAISGGPFKEGYNVVSGIDQFIPVDVYVPGCPPKPEALMFGLMKLQAKIDAGGGHEALHSPDHSAATYPIPLLGPDLVDTRRAALIARSTAIDPLAEQAALASEPPEVRKPRPARPGAVEPVALRSGQLRVSADPTLISALPFQPVAEPTAVAESTSAILPAEQMLDVLRWLKDDRGFDYLSNLTSVDYPDRFEVVYHLEAAEGREGESPRGALVSVNVAVSRAAPEVPSVVDLFAGADLQEREAFDMMGIRFAGHPNLRRILLWEGFAGYPLRKDYREPYFEQPVKPFDSRWPNGEHMRAEDRNPIGQNARYPAGWGASGLPLEVALHGDAAGPTGWDDPSQFARDEGLPVVEASSLRRQPVEADRLVVSFGPHHPSTHGVFRMIVELDGETVVRLEPVLGYLHRNHEKIGERNTYIQNIPFTDRLDYISSMSNNLGYVLAVEKLLGTAVPERAEYIRVIMAELTRIENHYLAIGTYMNDLGAFFTPALYAFEERELILDLFEMAAGSRMMCSYMRFGGVARDLPDGFLERLRELIDGRLPRSFDELDRFLTGNEIMVARSRGVGTLSAAQAVNLSVSGPLLRGSGVAFDLRKAAPYSIYDRFEFDVPTGKNGDCLDRFVVRLAEMRESLRILLQAARDLPGGETLNGKKLWQIRVPAGEAYSRIEAPKGELGFFVVSDGSPSAYRYHVRAPSFVNLGALDAMARGQKIADLIAIFGSIDINMGEVDR